MQSGERKRSPLHWLAADTGQAIENLVDPLHILNKHGPDAL